MPAARSGLAQSNAARQPHHKAKGGKPEAMVNRNLDTAASRGRHVTEQASARPIGSPLDFTVRHGEAKSLHGIVGDR